MRIVVDIFGEQAGIGQRKGSLGDGYRGSIPGHPREHLLILRVAVEGGKPFIFAGQQTVVELTEIHELVQGTQSRGKFACFRVRLRRCFHGIGCIVQQRFHSEGCVQVTLLVAGLPGSVRLLLQLRKFFHGSRRRLRGGAEEEQKRGPRFDHGAVVYYAGDGGKAIRCGDDATPCVRGRRGEGNIKFSGLIPQNCLRLHYRILLERNPQ